MLQRPLSTDVIPFDPSAIRLQAGSTDVGDVGYAAPTLNLLVATACVGNVGHSWQMTAQACSPLAHKGLLTAAEAMALSAVRTKHRPDAIAAAKADPAMAPLLEGKTIIKDIYVPGKLVNIVAKG